MPRERSNYSSRQWSPDRQHLRAVQNHRVMDLDMRDVLFREPLEAVLPERETPRVAAFVAELSAVDALGVAASGIELATRYPEALYARPITS